LLPRQNWDHSLGELAFARLYVPPRYRQNEKAYCEYLRLHAGFLHRAVHHANTIRLTHPHILITFRFWSNSTLYSLSGGVAILCNSPAITLEKSVGSQKSTQALNAPSKLKNLFITRKVTTQFFNSLFTSISCMSFLRPTDFSRITRHCALPRNE